ncbi:MAG: hypothetical protein HPY53_13150 [Brevinematales bacterium]|nr:hypothetical protein [Brevinematales bacterium]
MRLISPLILFALVFAACNTEVRPEWYSTIDESEQLLRQIVDLLYDIRLNPDMDYRDQAKTIYARMQELNEVYKKYIDSLSKEDMGIFREQYYSMEKRVKEYQVFKGFDSKIDIFKVIEKLAQ